ncbi:hypothetical protein SEA_JONJAMES_105 [Gordonia Phage JonJames]|nr:hypothetical protein SEA_JONJAMES_105 [Gordonia Phage JonJames]
MRWNPFRRRTCCQVPLVSFTEGMDLGARVTGIIELDREDLNGLVIDFRGYIVGTGSDNTTWLTDDEWDALEKERWWEQK